MAESQSRYSIIESLTKEKTDAEERIRNIKQVIIEKELKHKRDLKNFERQHEELVEAQERAEEDLNLFKEQAKLDEEFQAGRVKQLDIALAQLQNISALSGDGKKA